MRATLVSSDSFNTTPASAEAPGANSRHAGASVSTQKSESAEFERAKRRAETMNCGVSAQKLPPIIWGGPFCRMHLRPSQQVVPQIVVYKTGENYPRANGLPGGAMYLEHQKAPQVAPAGGCIYRRVSRLHTRSSLRTSGTHHVLFLAAATETTGAEERGPGTLLREKYEAKPLHTNHAIILFPAADRDGQFLPRAQPFRALSRSQLTSL